MRRSGRTKEKEKSELGYTSEIEEVSKQIYCDSMAIKDLPESVEYEYVLSSESASSLKLIFLASFIRGSAIGEVNDLVSFEHLCVNINL